MQHNNKKILFLLLFLLVFVGGIVVGANYFPTVIKIPPSAQPSLPPNPPPDDRGVACTMDAKICPDGSAVGRVPPNCEFAPCPSASDKKEPLLSECLDYLGNPQPAEACAGLPQNARSCTASADCKATCSKGCISKKATIEQMDCDAIPEYSCQCVNQTCAKK